MRELKLRGLVRRILVVAPKGLVTQWMAEMQTHFGEEFRLVLPADFAAPPRDGGTENLWRLIPGRVPDGFGQANGQPKGLVREQVAEFNRERFEDLITAGWDLVVVDEAHRIGGSSDQVARHRWGEAWRKPAPICCCCRQRRTRARRTPFTGWWRCWTQTAFPEPGSVTTRARSALRHPHREAAGDRCRWQPAVQAAHHQAGSASVGRATPDQQGALRSRHRVRPRGLQPSHAGEKNVYRFPDDSHAAAGDVSTRAILTTLEKRLAVLQAPGEQPTLLPLMTEDEWNDLDGQEQVESISENPAGSV